MSSPTTGMTIANIAADLIAWFMTLIPWHSSCFMQVAQQDNDSGAQWQAEGLSGAEAC